MKFYYIKDFIHERVNDMPYIKIIKDFIGKVNWKWVGISMLIGLWLFVIINNNNTTKKNIELSTKVESLKTQLKDKDFIISALEEKSKVERKLSENLQQSLLDHQKRISDIETKENERTKLLTEALNRSDWSKEKISDDVKDKLKRK